jgi:hypothetical protein
LTLEEAVRKMTSWPATRMRLPQRGLLKEGFWADVVVFELDRLHDRATYEEPTRFPTGVDWVLVNGEVVIDQGRHTGARPGHVLYGPGRTQPGGVARPAALPAAGDSIAETTSYSTVGSSSAASPGPFRRRTRAVTRTSWCSTCA